MQDQGGPIKSDSDRSAIDRHAVTAAGHLLMSALWLERRVRSFSTPRGTLPMQQALVVSVETSSAYQSDRGLSVPDGRGD
jgi:hypothetical protein